MTVQRRPTSGPASSARLNGVLKRLARGLGALSSALNRIAAVVAAILTVMMTVLILVEIAMRMFGRSTFMADALVGYGVAAITFLAAGWAFEHGSMIRVSALTAALSIPLRRACDAFATLSTLALMLFLMSYQWSLVSKLWGRGSVSQHYLPIPLWIPEAIFLTGLALLTLQLVVRALRLAADDLADEPTTLTL